jgi:hypothetical protein
LLTASAPRSALRTGQVSPSQASVIHAGARRDPPRCQGANLGHFGSLARASLGQDRTRLDPYFAHEVRFANNEASLIGRQRRLIAQSLPINGTDAMNAKTKTSAKKTTTKKTTAKKTTTKKAQATSGLAPKKPRVFAISFASVYPLYVQKAENKHRTKQEVDEIIAWLTGYSGQRLQRVIDDRVDLETFFAQAPRMNPNAALITGVVCGIRVEDIADPLMKKIRYLDKLIDELAKGKKLATILRQ